MGEKLKAAIIGIEYGLFVFWYK